MESESARMTSAHEASFRIQYPNSKPRSVKIIALDGRSARVLAEVARQSWNGAAFFTSVSFTAETSPGNAQGTSLHAWLGDLAGRTMELVTEVASSDFIVVIATAGEDAQAVSVVSDACSAHSKSLLALVVPRDGASDDDIAKSLKHLRPYAKMLVVANDVDYISAMLTALRA